MACARTEAAQPPIATRRNDTPPGAVRPLAPGAQSLSSRSAEPESVLTYLRGAVLHPANLLLLTMMGAFALITGSLWLLLFWLPLTEAIVVGSMTRSHRFRRLVDEGIERARRLEAAKARDVVMLQMNDFHRQELERLEVLVAKIRQNGRRHGGSAQAVLDDCLAPDRLLGAYIRLAIAYKTTKQALELTNRQDLADEMALLEAAQLGCSSDRLRRLKQRRRAIVQRRAECWDRNRETLEAVGHQLATISDLIRLMHEQSMCPMDSSNVSEEIDQFMAELEDNQDTLRQLAELGVEDLEALRDPRLLVRAA
jgi:hypothetical protein